MYSCEMLSKQKTQMSYVSWNNWDNNKVNLFNITAIGIIMRTNDFV